MAKKQKQINFTSLKELPETILDILHLQIGLDRSRPRTTEEIADLYRCDKSAFLDLPNLLKHVKTLHSDEELTNFFLGRKSFPMLTKEERSYVRNILTTPGFVITKKGDLVIGDAKGKLREEVKSLPKIILPTPVKETKTYDYKNKAKPADLPPFNDQPAAKVSTPEDERQAFNDLVGEIEEVHKDIWKLHFGLGNAGLDYLKLAEIFKANAKQIETVITAGAIFKMEQPLFFKELLSGRDVLSVLNSDEEARVLRRYYGIGVSQQTAFASIAFRLGLSEENVEELYKTGSIKLAEAFQTTLPEAERAIEQKKETEPKLDRNEEKKINFRKAQEALRLLNSMTDDEIAKLSVASTFFACNKGEYFPTKLSVDKIYEVLGGTISHAIKSGYIQSETRFFSTENNDKDKKKLIPPFAFYNNEQEEILNLLHGFNDGKKTQTQLEIAECLKINSTHISFKIRRMSQILGDLNEVSSLTRKHLTEYYQDMLLDNIYKELDDQLKDRAYGRHMTYDQITAPRHREGPFKEQVKILEIKQTNARPLFNDFVDMLSDPETLDAFIKSGKDKVRAKKPDKDIKVASSAPSASASAPAPAPELEKKAVGKKIKRIPDFLAKDLSADEGVSAGADVPPVPADVLLDQGVQSNEKKTEDAPAPQPVAAAPVAVVAPKTEKEPAKEGEEIDLYQVYTAKGYSRQAACVLAMIHTNKAILMLARPDIKKVCFSGLSGLDFAENCSQNDMNLANVEILFESIFEDLHNNGAFDMASAPIKAAAERQHNYNIVSDARVQFMLDRLKDNSVMMSDLDGNSRDYLSAYGSAHGKTLQEKSKHVAEHFNQPILAVKKIVRLAYKQYLRKKASDRSMS